MSLQNCFSLTLQVSSPAFLTSAQTDSTTNQQRSFYIVRAVKSTHLQLYQKLTPPQMFSASAPRIFEITGKASLVDLLLTKVTGEISVFCNSFKNSQTFIVMFQKLALVEISRTPLLTGVAHLQPYGQACSLNSLQTRDLQNISRK